jgi:hypothetical protein
MKTKLIFLIIFFVGSLFLPAAQSYSFSGYLPKVFKEGNTLNIKIDANTGKKEFYIYYRAEGLKHFQVRKMSRDKEGNVYYRLSTENLYGNELEYFIVESKDKMSDSISPVFTIKGFTDAESPEIYFQDSGTVPESSEPKKDPLFFKISPSLSTASQIHDDREVPDKKFDANGNLRVYKNVYNEDFQFDFDSNFTYMHNPSEDEKKFNLTSMKIAFRKGVHTIEAGDVSVNGTEFTTSYLQRRGFFYQMDGKKLYLSSFCTNSQQKTGFDGFGVPSSNAFLVGATAGVNVSTIFKARGMFLTGKDNVDSKTVFSTEDPYREGNLYSLWGEFNLFENHLSLKGEFSRSSFGRAADKDSLEKESDTAWRVGGDFNYGVVTAHVDYKKVGGEFGSIANLFLETDWEGLAGNISLMIKSFSLNVRYTDRKTNLNSTIQPMLHAKNLGADFSWLVVNHLQLGAEFSVDNLDYDKSTGLPTGTEDMDTIRYAGTLGYISGSNSIMLRLGKSESKTFTSDIDASVAMNLKFGSFFSFSPTFSYQSNENFSDSSTTKVYNAFLSSELTFIPELFSLSLTGSWTKTDNSAFSDSTILTVQGNANLFLSKFFKNKIQATLSLRGKYEESKTGDIEDDYVTVYLHADLSF